MGPVYLSYLDTEHGQLHARCLGQGEPVVLLHLTPGSGTQFEHIMPALAQRGYQVWAIDLLGNGRSAKLPENYTFELAARALIQAIDVARLESIKLVGGHMSAQIAVSLVIQQPDLATHLVIDGLPMWDRATREHIIGLFDNTEPVPSEDGSHVLEAWEKSLRLQRAWNPGLKLNEAGCRRLSQAMIGSLEQGQDMTTGARAFLEFEVKPLLPSLKLPTLVTTATEDTLFDQHDATLAEIPQAIPHEFIGPHPRHVESQADVYADVLSRFFQTKSNG